MLLRDHPGHGCADASPHQLGAPVLRALDLACMKRPMCLVQDEAFGVLHQVVAVSLQPVGDSVVCAARRPPDSPAGPDATAAASAKRADVPNRTSSPRQRNSRCLVC